MMSSPRFNEPDFSAALAAPPVILDLDQSVLPVADDEIRLPLTDWQESLRFALGWRAWRNWQRFLQQTLPANPGVVFMGSGDFHHLTLSLLARLGESLPANSLTVVVADNHPDNMRFPFGIHCGSWVAHAAKLPAVRKIHVVGMTSPDIGWAHAWENHWTPLLRGKLQYWAITQTATWLSYLGKKQACRVFANAQDLLKQLRLSLLGDEQNDPAETLYFSLDKDVFAPQYVTTNWDQGVMAPRAWLAFIHEFLPRTVGADVCGECSLYQYRQAYKHWLSALDEQPAVDASALAAIHRQQQAINQSIVRTMRGF